MRLFATLFTATLLWQTILAVKTTFNDDGTISTTKDYQASYPVSVTAPEPGDGKGPQSDPFPALHTFSKAALLGALTQALKKKGSGQTYPKNGTLGVQYRQ